MAEKSPFRSLLEMSDKIAREELGDYYVMGASRMRNMLDCLEEGAEKIAGLSRHINQITAERDKLQSENEFLTKELNYVNKEVRRLMSHDQTLEGSTEPEPRNCNENCPGNIGPCENCEKLHQELLKTIEEINRIHRLKSELHITSHKLESALHSLLNVDDYEERKRIIDGVGLEI